MRFGAATIRELRGEVDGAVKVQAAIIIDIDIQSPEIGRSVNETDFARLDKVVGDRNVFLIRGNLDIMGTNDTLVLVGVIQTLHVIEVADVKCSDMVARSQGEVGEPAVFSDIGAGGPISNLSCSRVIFRKKGRTY